ncbi:HnRNP A1-gamma isoform [Mycena chlorophos]|uniref:HnRNP A1-gamma isoform n=1 Tax=Mycena chlorophos TaxID=658473 RepID=A0A8H6T9J1_MYCCL|nr:HnRNP A1-gamma isoform [Mycena chlorophos]
MSKAPMDDLYGDIYGDEDLEIPEVEEEASADSLAAEIPPAPPPATSTIVKPESLLTLPAKPVPSTQPASNSLSYSAQIAQQFSSAYKQTPNQERQRPEASGGGSGSGGHDALQTSPIPTHGTQTYVSGETVFGKKPSEMHDSGKMFVGGLNWETTDESLRNYFSQFGKVDACTIMRDPSGTSRGFAFMTFEDAASVAQVIGREHMLDGKSIDPKRAIPREEHLRNTRYFVGGLSPVTTSESMKAFFSAFGKVVDATVMVDRETGRGKGFGFVTFEDAANADQLVGKLGLQIDDKEIEVKMAQPRSQRDRERASGGGGGGGSSSQGSAIPTYSSQPQQTAPQQQNQQNQQQQQQPMQMFRPGGGMMGNAGGMMGPMGGMGMNPMANMGNMGMGMGMGMGMNGMNGMSPMMMGMGMNGMNPMGGMGMMGMGMGMNPMGAMAGPMRMGMGPMMAAAGGAGTGAAGMGMGMPLRGGMGINFGRTAAGGMMNGGGTGPTRTNTRGHNSFHPYSR